MNLTARVRALPITPPPMSGETIGSFLHRLADDNRTTDGWPPEALPRLAALTGRNVLTLQHALPALRTVGTNAPSHPRANIPNRPVRLACRLCAARRGAHGVVLRRTADHECVCPTHRRWLNTGEQLGLTALPEVLQANKRHRRIPRGHDTDYLQAAQLTSGWYFQTDGPPELRHRWDRRLAALPTDPFGDPYRPSHARVELVAYPESVTLASLFASAHWQESDLLPAEAGRRLGIPCPVQAKMTSRRAIDLKSVILTWTI
ncbi:hypothetical protein MXD62_13490 [Frankia sp. Mgl5]|uniref:hypothetical protein n=1 Tax=Frankia sp. Mgl5 TaxID=2933793 RepID=UPI00200D30CD|nr:hypothetical protein [Frankia sp. Mgl5]MCK9928175.1 hypothetical protein [Frankia sp. Mgl5]